MTLTSLRSQLSTRGTGAEMFALMERLYPICRSITGDGLRSTLDIIKEHLPGLEVRGVPSGTQAFDWTVPREWNITDAWVKDAAGNKVIDFARSNLHVVNYSMPTRRRMPLSELKEHLHSLPENPQWIPYRTSYYREDWGFCLAHEELERLADGEYEVLIDSTLEQGQFNWGEWVVPGEIEDEVLITTHVCHPSLCNDNLSGIVVATHLAAQLATLRPRYTYRFLFMPGGIGSVVWMSQNEDVLPRIRHGLVLNCLGDPGDFTYKLTRRGDAEIDRAVPLALRDLDRDFKIIDFSPYGYDERNFCSAKFNLPVGSLSRSTHSSYPGYHSSGDNLGLMSAERLGESLAALLAALDVLERNQTYRNLIPEAEPQLGKRGLYGLKGGLQARAPMEVALLWVMNMSDGEHSLLDIAERSGCSFDVLAEGAGLLCGKEILVPIDEPARRAQSSKSG